MKYCGGCGIVLQSERPDESGFVPLTSLERDNILCKRCFRIRHYGDIQPVKQTESDFTSILRDLKKRKGLILYVVDLFNLEGSMIPGSLEFLEGKPIIMIGNKADLLPRSVKREGLKRYVKSFALKKGIRLIDVVVCSAEKGDNIEGVINSIEVHRNGRDAYVIGTTNVGKSTLMNRIIPLLGEGIGDAITTSNCPGTTLGSISIPLQDGKELIDTPGFLKKDPLHAWLSVEEYKTAIPRKVVHPTVYQLMPQQTLFLGGLVRMDFMEGMKQSFTIYTSNQLHLHRTKWENADAVFESQRGKLLVPPQDPAVLPSWKKVSFHLEGGEKQDIVIGGLGWISCGKEPANLCIWTPEGIEVSRRLALV